jgi:hypothetical protein
MKSVVLVGGAAVSLVGWGRSLAGRWGPGPPTGVFVGGRSDNDEVLRFLWRRIPAAPEWVELKLLHFPHCRSCFRSASEREPGGSERDESDDKDDPASVRHHESTSTRKRLGFGFGRPLARTRNVFRTGGRTFFFATFLCLLCFLASGFCALERFLALDFSFFRRAPKSFLALALFLGSALGAPLAALTTLFAFECATLSLAHSIRPREGRAFGTLGGFDTLGGFGTLGAFGALGTFDNLGFAKLRLRDQGRGRVGRRVVPTRVDVVQICRP